LNRHKHRLIPTFLSRDGEQFGPYYPEQIQSMLDAGEVLPTDYYWQEGMAEWGVVGEKWTASPPPQQKVAEPPKVYAPAPKAKNQRKKGRPTALYIAVAGMFAFLAAFLFLYPGKSSAPNPVAEPLPVSSPVSQSTPEPTTPQPSPSPSQSTPEATGDQLRIVAWNLEWYPGGRQGASFEEQFAHEAKARDELAKIAPDVFLAQEIRSWRHFDQLVSILPDLRTAVVSAFRMGPQVGLQQVAIASRLPVNSAWAEEWKRSSPTPPRGFSSAVLEVPQTGKLLLVYSVHLKSNVAKRPGDEQANYLKREESVRQLLNHVRAMEDLFAGRISGIVVGGDFNTNHDGQFPDRTIAMMVGAGFHNTWADTPAAQRHTWRGSSRHRATTLDYLFTKGLGVPRAKLLPTKASDHQPLEISVPVAELAD